MLEVELGVADDVAERPGQTEVVHRLLEVGDAVLDRDVVRERRRAGTVDGDLEAGVALDGERAQVLEGVRQLVQALAVEQEWLERGALLRADLLGTGRRRRFERDRRDRLVHGVDEERVLERDVEVVEAALVRLGGGLGADVEPGRIERQAEPIGDLLLEAEAQGECPSVSRVVPFGPGDDELVLRIHVLCDERLDERTLSDYAVGVRPASGDAAEQDAHGAHVLSHERFLRAATTATPSSGCLLLQASTKGALGGSVGGSGDGSVRRASTARSRDEPVKAGRAAAASGRTPRNTGTGTPRAVWRPQAFRIPTAAASWQRGPFA
ncbi:MAG: hypothetical protein E6J79_15790 [Deltaproteobacteria bacterium]|nr:MAG: hypothetical protein E6J79_15790 [Deltaproteobacteria bacterium]